MTDIIWITAKSSHTAICLYYSYDNSPQS